jgi:hypothetical protein
MDKVSKIHTAKIQGHFFWGGQSAAGMLIGHTRRKEHTNTNIVSITHKLHVPEFQTCVFLTSAKRRRHADWAHQIHKHTSKTEKTYNMHVNQQESYNKETILWKTRRIKKMTKKWWDKSCDSYKYLCRLQKTCSWWEPANTCTSVPQEKLSELQITPDDWVVKLLVSRTPWASPHGRYQTYFPSVHHRHPVRGDYGAGTCMYIKKSTCIIATLSIGCGPKFWVSRLHKCLWISGVEPNLVWNYCLWILDRPRQPWHSKRVMPPPWNPSTRLHNTYESAVYGKHGSRTLVEQQVCGKHAGRTPFKTSCVWQPCWQNAYW